MAARVVAGTASAAGCSVADRGDRRKNPATPQYNSLSTCVLTNCSWVQPVLAALPTHVQHALTPACNHSSVPHPNLLSTDISDRLCAPSGRRCQSPLTVVEKNPDEDWLAQYTMQKLLYLLWGRLHNSLALHV